MVFWSRGVPAHALVPLVRPAWNGRGDAVRPSCTGGVRRRTPGACSRRMLSPCGDGRRPLLFYARCVHSPYGGLLGLGRDGNQGTAEPFVLLTLFLFAEPSLFTLHALLVFDELADPMACGQI